MRPNNTEKIPESHYRDLSGDSSSSTIANNPQNANDQIACKFLRRQIIGRDTLYEGNIRKTPVSPGELIEPGYNTEASDRNIAREAQNINDENDHATIRKSPMEPAGMNPSTELHHLGDSRVDSVTNNTTGLNTLYEGNVRSQEKSRPGDLNGAPRGQAERGLGDFSNENIAREVQNVNEVDKLGNVLAYDISGIRKSTGRGLEGSAISADALDQSIDNSSIAKDPQDVNSDKFQHPLQETINEMEANPKPRMTRELREAIDEFIYENIDHNLFNNNAIV